MSNISTIIYKKNAILKTHKSVKMKIINNRNKIYGKKNRVKILF